jgi:hypothetical protein
MWERKVLRKIFGAGAWCIVTNDEVYKLYGALQLVAEVKKMRLQYLGPVVRVEEGRVPKKILDQHPGGRRKPGRPRKRCHQGSGSAWDSRLEEAGLGQEKWAKTVAPGD